MVISKLFLPYNSNTNTNDRYYVADTVKAQIEITVLSNGLERYAKAFDKVKAGEKFQIHIKGEQDYFLWILNSNSSTTTILIDTTIISKSFVTFPSNQKYFEFDGKDSQENLVIFLAVNNSPKNAFKKLKNHDLLKYIKDKSDQSKCNICEEGEPLININGNLRDLPLDKHQLTKYLGINYLIKEYKFNVKK